MSISFPHLPDTMSSEIEKIIIIGFLVGHIQYFNICTAQRKEVSVLSGCPDNAKFKLISKHNEYMVLC